VRASKRWRGLSREIARLREHFLPDPFNRLGVYPNANRVRAHTRAFVVLSHAEIECYLEDWAKEIARSAEDVWASSGKITEPLAFLFAMLTDRLEVLPKAGGALGKDSLETLREASKKLFPRYYRRIKENNGIREKNVLALFGPLGVSTAGLGSTLLPNLDSLGTLRGTYAHESAKAVPTAPDPETEFARVGTVLNELVPLDESLQKCRRRIR
jgi:hypothetical protein